MWKKLAVLMVIGTIWGMEIDPIEDYEKSQELTKLMHGDDAYTIDDRTRYKMSPIIRLDHAYIAS